MSVSDVFLDTEFKLCFQNFSITHTFRSKLKGWNLLLQHTKVCFYRGRHEEFKDFFSQEDGFATMFVPLSKFLAMNITHISGACSHCEILQAE